MLPRKWSAQDGLILCFCRQGGTSSAHAAPGEAIPQQQQRRGDLLSAGKQLPATAIFPIETMEAARSKILQLGPFAFYHQGNHILELPPSCLSARINKINTGTGGGWGAEGRGAAAGEQPRSLPALVISLRRSSTRDPCHIPAPMSGSQAVHGDSLPSPEQGTRVCNLRTQPRVKGTGHGYKFGKQGPSALERERSKPTSHAAVPFHVLSGMCL